MVRTGVAWCLAACITPVLLGAGCGTNGTKAPGFEPEEDAGAFVTPDAPPPPAPEAGACNGPRCSSDLHSMIDCDGKVLSTCPPDQGCTDHGCVPACDAATA